MKSPALSRPLSRHSTERSGRTARLLTGTTALTAAALLTTAALAQSTPAAGPAATATGAQTTQATQATAPAYSMGAVTATADRTEKTAIDTTAPVSVRTLEDLQKDQPSSVSDMLRGIPGLTAYQTAGQPGTKINIRGLQDFGRINVMVDGARQSFQRSSHGESTMVFLDPELVSQVDVVRGPSAVVYGSGAIGGVVNFQTKDAKDLLRPGQSFGGQASGQWGSNAGEGRGTLSAYGLADWADAVASLSYSDRGSYKGGDGKTVPRSGWSTASGLAKLTLTPNDAHQIRLSGLRSRFEYDAGSATATDELTTTTDTFGLRHRFTPESTRLIDLTTNLTYSTTDQDETRKNGSLAGRDTTVTVKTPGIDIFNTSRFETGSVGHALTVGGDAFHDDVSTSRASGPLEFTPSGERTLIGAYVQDEITLNERVTLTTALRFDSYSMDGDAASMDDTALSPKITLGYEVIPGMQVYGSWSQAFRAPSITETLISGNHPAPAAFKFVPNPGLKPETAENFEFGTNVKAHDLALSGDRLHWKTSVYRADVDDYINQYFNMVMGGMGPDWAKSTYGYRNEAEVTLHGLESEVVYDAGFMYAGLSMTHARGKNNETGKKLTSGLGTRASLTVGARDRSNGLDGGWKMDGRLGLDKAHDSGDGVQAGGYLLHGLYVGYTPPELDDRLTLRASVDNLFDKQIRDRIQTDSLEEGRTFKLGGTVRF